MVHRRVHVVRWLILCAALLVVPRTALAQPPVAQSSLPAIGFQGGGSIDPEQVFAGVFFETPQIGGRFSLRPGIDGGFGNDLRVATINIDFIVRFPIGASGWNFVQGGGPTVVITRIPDLDVTDTSAGGSYIIGFAHDNGFLGEFRIGGGNVPNLKMAAGWAIRF
jgi:hypothetical protein